MLRGDIFVSPATMRSIAPTEFGIPVVVESELLIAAAQSRDAERNTQIVRQFLLPFEKVPYDSSCCNDRVPNVGVRDRFPGRRKQEAVIA